MYECCKKNNEKRKLDSISASELDRLRGHYFVTVCKSNGSIYEPVTLTSFQKSNDRYLIKDLCLQYSILQDTQFAPSRKKLKVARKFLKSQGKGINQMQQKHWRQQKLSSSGVNEVSPVTTQGSYSKQYGG